MRGEYLVFSQWVFIFRAFPIHLVMGAYPTGIKGVLILR